MKMLIATVILIAVSMLTAWAADAPQVKIHVFEAPNEQPKTVEKQPAVAATDVDVRGSITVIGPDGVMHTQSFGNADGAGQDAEQLIERVLQAAGASLPANVQQTVKQAIRQQSQAGGDQPVGEAADIAAKLDQILDRLGKIQRDIAQLKAAQRN